MTEGEGRVAGPRALAERIAERIGGSPAVVRVQAVLDTFDRAGGGLMAAGLAYTSLLALLPGLLLALSIVGYLVRDPAVQARIVNLIGEALPPLKDLAAQAFQQVSTGWGPSGIIAVIGLFWGASRFYANLDTAFSRIFLGAPRRNPIVQTIRGVVLVLILVVVPVVLVAVTSLIAWIERLTPGTTTLPTVGTVVMDLMSPLGSLAVFVVVVALCYRLVPSEHVGWRALGLPAGGAGLALAVLTQLYGLLFQLLVGVAALYGTVVAVFALLAWLSLGFNVLLIGAAWTEVRAHRGVLTKLWATEQPERVGSDSSADPGES